MYLFLSSNFERGALQEFSTLRRCTSGSPGALPEAPLSTCLKASSGHEQRFNTHAAKSRTRLKTTGRRARRTLSKLFRPVNSSRVKTAKRIDGSFPHGDTGGHLVSTDNPGFNGIIEISEVSLRIAFPAYTIPPDCPLIPIQLTGPFLPPQLFPPISLFATSYTNRGTNRALAIFVKKHCSAPAADGVCFFPCYPRNWRSECRVGTPTHITDDGTVQMDGNWLIPVAKFCDQTNPIATHSRATQRQCAASGLSLEMSFEERIKIADCHMIIGTGNWDECTAAIHRQLLDPQIPAHQEFSSFGAVTPAEIGRFLRPTDTIYILGEPVVAPMRLFEEWNSKLPQGESVESSGKGEFMKLLSAARKYCEGSFITDRKGDLSDDTVSLSQFDFCFKVTYTYALLHDLRVTADGPEVYFKGSIRNSATEQFDFDWARGSVLHSILKDTFIQDLSYMKSDYWRTVTSNDVCRKQEIN